jgi:hypothetical protein
MSSDIVQLFYDSTAFSTVSATDPDYFSTQSVREVYGPFGLTFLNNALNTTLSVSWTASSPTTGDPVKDAIVAEFAGFLGDQKKDAWHIDPETGQRVNRHWETGLNLLRQNYGVLIGDRPGDIVQPGVVDSRRGAASIAVANASTDVLDDSDV